LQEATKKPVKLGAAVKHKSATLEPEKQEQSLQEQSLHNAAKEPVKPGDVAAERTEAKQVEQETATKAAKTAVNCGLAKKTKQPVSCSLGTSLALARSAGIHALPLDLAGLRAHVG
jgi:hypothetical protein